MRHETPTQDIFEEMKTAAIQIWNTYDNTYGHVTEKVERVNSISNFQDNAMVFFRMFDNINQNKMWQELSNDTKQYIKNNR